MSSFVHDNWKGHLGISVSELCFKNALGLLINNRSNFREEWIIVRKVAVSFREERIIARKFGMNHWAKRIIIRKIARIKTIGVTKMRGGFVEISFQAKFLRKATKSQEFCRNLFALLLHNTVERLHSTLAGADFRRAKEAVLFFPHHPPPTHTHTVISTNLCSVLLLPKIFALPFGPPS